ncbi:MAG: FadR family transcriptional regulator [Chroococcidiopsidaceae cyanobacterium CP_BM_ER_R8_30]|nr:FadR family transcriptional regulator [Chroococcidiopsidaceae cyanobacterium CP_BM_ER_R8_30]
MNANSLKVQRRQLAEQVVEKLQELIMQGEVDVGAKLPPEPELMVQLGVGRSTLREAVRVLTHMGILEVRQGDGTYVRAKTVKTEPLERRLQRAAILEVYEVRRLLELEIARLAATRRDETDLAHMRHCLQERRTAQSVGDRSAFFNADVAFHLAVANASKNAVLAELYQTFATALRSALVKLDTDTEVQRTDQAALHEQVLNAIAAGDADGAERWTAEFLDRISQQLQQMLC